MTDTVSAIINAAESSTAKASDLPAPIAPSQEASPADLTKPTNEAPKKQRNKHQRKTGALLDNTKSDRSAQPDTSASPIAPLTSEPPTAEPKATASAPSPTSAQTPSPSPSQALKYHVARIPLSRHLPIYQKFKARRTLKQTWVQKITGDRSLLCNDLAKHLRLKGEDAKVNQLTGKIILKGHWKPEVMQFLEARGF